MFFKPKKIKDFDDYFHRALSQRETPVITTQNSEIIRAMDFHEKCYLFNTVEECENFWSQEWAIEDRDDPVLNILGEDGEVREVDVFSNDERFFRNNDNYYKYIDLSSLEFVRMEGVKEEIHSGSSYFIEITTEALFCYPIFKLKAL